MNLALYGTIWIALVLFCAGEVGRRDFDAGRHPTSLAWWAYATGALLLVIHIVIAMGYVHHWSHESAFATVAERTFAVYGVRSGSGVYTNYAFTAVWLFEAIRWRIRSATPTPRHAAIAWAIRVFYLVMILNAAVIFTPAPRSFDGAAMVLCLLWIWRPMRRRSP